MSWYAEHSTRSFGDILTEVIPGRSKSDMIS